jgi:hypothetical protein
MKVIVLSLLLYCLLIISYVDFGKGKFKEIYLLNDGKMDLESNEVSLNKIRIMIGNKTFTASILNNATANAFKEIVPLTFEMKELNKNEKYCQLPKKLPSNPIVPEGIQSGDLMLFGSKTLVLFYKSFSTSYSYTKIGSIDDVRGLSEVLGNGDISITFLN